MNPQGLQFKKFKNDFKAQKTNLKQNQGMVRELTPKTNKIKENVIHKSPQKQPTSFRELSGSRDKNKLFSGKKEALENKLNTLRNAEPTMNSKIISDQKNLVVITHPHQENSGNKEGIFKKLFTSRSPTSGIKVLNFDESKDSINGAHESSSGMTFSAFKGVTLAQENLDISNLTLNKAVSAEEKTELKGLKFKGFPHKKIHANNQQNKTKTQTSILFAQTLISQKGRSNSKNKKNVKGLQQIKIPTKNSNIKQNKNNVFQKIQQKGQQAVKNFRQIFSPRRFEYNLQNSRQTIQQPDQVIRSREGSMVFDMSPYLC